MPSVTSPKPGLAPRAGWAVHENSASSTATASVCLDEASTNQPLPANDPHILVVSTDPDPEQVLSFFDAIAL